MSNSTLGKPKRRLKQKPNKPSKPYQDFPLYPHNLGYWSVKIDGKTRHFGRWGRMKKGVVIPIDGSKYPGSQEALANYKAQIDDIQSGFDLGRSVVRTKAQRDAANNPVAIKDLCQKYLDEQYVRLQTGKISLRSFSEMQSYCQKMVVLLGRSRSISGLQQSDFTNVVKELSRQGLSPITSYNVIRSIKAVFTFAKKEGWIADVPAYGHRFVKPSEKEIAEYREENQQAERYFTAVDIRRLLQSATSSQMRAMILLGINCGFGPKDCAELELSHIDFENSEISYRRKKTMVPRICPIWPETAEAIKASLNERVEPANKRDKGLVFLTRYGNRWVENIPVLDADGTVVSSKAKNALTQAFKKLLGSLDIGGKGVGMYALRHTFETVARGAADESASDRIMGHKENHIRGNYTHGFPRERLIKVSNHVRSWLFGEVA